MNLSLHILSAYSQFYDLKILIFNLVFEIGGKYRLTSKLHLF